MNGMELIEVIKNSEDKRDTEKNKIIAQNQSGQWWLR